MLDSPSAQSGGAALNPAVNPAVMGLVTGSSTATPEAGRAALYKVIRRNG